MKIQLQRLLIRLSDMMSVHRGATVIEYGLILFAIAGLIIAIVTAIGGETGFGFGSVNNNYADVKPVEIN